MSKSIRKMFLQSEKERSLDLAVATIEKQFGKGAIMRLGGMKK